MLKRKARMVGSSLVVTLPSQMADLYGIREGDLIEFILGKNQIIIQKVRKDGTGTEGRAEAEQGSGI